MITKVANLDGFDLMEITDGAQKGDIRKIKIAVGEKTYVAPCAYIKAVDECGIYEERNGMNRSYILRIGLRAELLLHDETQKSILVLDASSK